MGISLVSMSSGRLENLDAESEIVSALGQVKERENALQDCSSGMTLGVHRRDDTVGLGGEVAAEPLLALDGVRIGAAHTGLGRQDASQANSGLFSLCVNKVGSPLATLHPAERKVALAMKAAINQNQRSVAPSGLETVAIPFSDARSAR